MIMKKNKPFFKFNYLFFILLLSLFIVINFFIKIKNTTQIIAIIEQDKQEIYRVNLSNVKEPYIINIDAKYPTKILIESGKISFFEPTCPDKICKHYGKLSQPGQVAICLPDKISIRIDGKSKTIDSITG